MTLQSACGVSFVRDEEAAGSNPATPTQIGYGHPDVAKITGKTEVNCRQIFARARQRIAAGGQVRNSAPGGPRWEDAVHDVGNRALSPEGSASGRSSPSWWC